MSTYWELIASGPSGVILADDHGGSLTGPQLAAAAEATAAGLFERGVRAGDVVSWQLPTVLAAPVLLSALARLGAIQNPIIGILREREVVAITRQAGTSLLIVPEVWRGFSHGDMARSIGGFDVLALGEDLALPTGDAAMLPPPPPSTSGDEPRWIYFSSGTTADPKGARHTDASLMASAGGMVEHLGLRAPDVYPIAWPFPHIGGATMLASCLRGGARLVLFDAWDPVTTPERMAAHRPTVLGSAQPFFRAYLDAQKRHGEEPLFPDLRTCTGGGAPTPPEVVRELVEAFGVRGVVQSWGLTEFPIATCAFPDDPPDVLAETNGQPSPGVSVRVVDGELRLKGPQCFGGYLDRSLDAAAFDEEGWFRTGDLGDVDATGNVRITGRLKDVIIRNAENISALEVEDVLLRHRAVADVAVIGLPDPRTGERLCAVVVVADGADPPTVASLAAHCVAQGLAKQKCPEQVEVVEALQRNGMGKLLKEKLKTQLGVKTAN